MNKLDRPQSFQRPQALVENRWIGQRIDEPGLDISGLAKAQGVASEGPVLNVPELLAAMKRGLEWSRAEGPM